MMLFTCLLFLPGQIETTENPHFSRQLQVRAITATVRITNLAGKSDGSGVIVGKQGSFVYILTAYHVVKGAEELEIEVFTEKSHPKAEAVYRSARVIAKSSALKDLALLRVVTEDPMPAILPLSPVAQVPKGAGFATLGTGCSQGGPPTEIVHNVLGRKKVSHKGGGETAYFWECAGTISQGRSGGPLIDKRGYVVGICSGTNGGKGYFSHAEEIHHFLKQNVFEWLCEKSKEP